MFYNFFTSFICQQLLHSTPPLFPICPFTFSLLCSSSCISFLVFLSSSPFLMVFLLSTYLLPSLSSLPLLLYHHHIFLHPFSSPCPSSHLFFNHVLQIPPSLIHFLHAISPPPHYVLPLLLVLIPFLFILLPPCSPLFFSHHLSSFPFSHLSSRSLFLPFFYFHPLLLSQSWSLYLIHQSSKPVMIQLFTLGGIERKHGKLSLTLKNTCTS